MNQKPLIAVQAKDIRDAAFHRHDQKVEPAATRVLVRSDEKYAKFTDPTDHDYQKVEKTAKAATCTESGKEADLVCANCGEVIEGKAIPVGHKWGAWNVAKQATLTKQGEKKRECTVCGETETQATPYTIKGAKVVLVNAVFTYNGKVRKPTVKTIGGKTLKYGTDYTVTYKNNKNVGKGTLTIKGKGKYTGTATKTFKINPKGTSIDKLTKAKKAAAVKWKKRSAKMSKSHITGYQIQLATNQKFTRNKKLVTVKGYSSNYRKITGLKGGKKYYVHIRTYKKIGDITYYSPWSGYRTVTTGK